VTARANSAAAPSGAGQALRRDQNGALQQEIADLTGLVRQALRKT